MLLCSGRRWNHLVKHPVGKAEHLSKSIQPAVEEGKESQEEDQDSCKRPVLGQVQFKNKRWHYFNVMDMNSYLVR